MRSLTQHSEKGNDGGLTLIEVLVALLLLSFVGLGSISLMTVALKQNKLASRRSEATSLAVERLENITAQKFQGSSDYANYARPGESVVAGPPATLTSVYGAISGFPAFQRVVTLTYNVPVAGMLEAKVDVSWRDQQQGIKTHTLITYLHSALDAR